MAPRNAHSLRTAPEYLRFQDGGGLSKEAVMAAMTRMYSTDAQVAQVPLDAIFKKAGIDFNVADSNLKAKLAMVGEKVKAAVASAQQMATQAAAALNNLNVSTSVTNGTTTSFRQN